MENKSKLHEDRFSSEKILLEPDYLTDYLQLKKHEVANKNNKEIRNILEYMILILVGLFGLIYFGGALLVLSLIGIRKRVRFVNGYDSELEADWLAMVKV